jgi:hypothetical protein
VSPFIPRLYPISKKEFDIFAIDTSGVGVVRSGDLDERREKNRNLFRRNGSRRERSRKRRRFGNDNSCWRVLRGHEIKGESV